ncbi:Cytochrome P450 [Niveomyces insectorum RCEF 264]|uniref:Cytochrome P450 n=1 Tax=Niveomyces insectorum RCEF 264 TaxID=1081102 RepID=A0A168A5F2_9HYPO|nr:Cytochrome P450 [Niveomyces insectorum RCEF 264]
MATISTFVDSFIGYKSDLVSLSAVLSLARIVLVTPIHLDIIFQALCGVVGRAVYNLFFHPLHNVPGPWWYAVSGLAQFYALVTGQNPQTLHRLHKKYGDVVRVAPNEVSFAGPQSWNDVYGRTRAAAPKNPEGGGGLGSRPPVTYLENPKDPVFFEEISSPGSIIHMDRPSHEIARRTLGSAFSATAVADQEPLIQAHITALMGLFRKAATAPGTSPAPVDVVSYFTWATFDILGDLAFGEPFGSLAAGKEHEWVSLFSPIVNTASMRVNLRRLLGDSLARFASPLVVPAALLNRIPWHRALSREMVRRRLDKGPGRPDFMTAMLASDSVATGSPPFWTHQRIAGTSQTLIVAGSETSATTLSAAVYFLTAEPGAGQPGTCLARLRDEVRGAFASDADINFAGVRQLPYLAAVLDEAIRLHPPPAGGFTRVARAGGASACGYYMPEGTVLAISHYAMYRNRHNFVLAEEFHPERWLGEDPRFKDDRKDAYQPFSYGPRNCLGRYLANAEMRAILAHIVWNFDLELCPDSRTWNTDQKAMSFWNKGPLNVIVKPRAVEAAA